MKYHFIAIGGTGMGALAGLLKASGHDVRGSDRAIYPPMSDQLRAMKIEVFSGFDPANLDWGPDQVVVGNVCSKDHPEVLEAERRGLPLLSLPGVLEDRFLRDRNSLVVAGTHGKTTTSSLLAHILTDSDRDPSFFIGGVPLNVGRGWRLGNGRDFVVEGDEYDSAFFDKGSKFLHYCPNRAILTSIELDHVDIFESMDAVRDTFRKFIELLPSDGLLIVSADSDEATTLVADHARCRVETYRVRTDDSDGGPATWEVRDVQYLPTGRVRFNLYREDEVADQYETLLGGEHNLANVAAAVALAHSLDVPADRIRSAVSSFAGVKRRQEQRGIAQGVTVIDDYAHHPTSVALTLQGLEKRFPNRRLIAIYDPRSATSRRSTFQQQFVTALGHADAVVVGKLHAPEKIAESERFDPEQLASELRQNGITSSYLEDTDGIVAHTVDLVRPGDVVAVLSSGAFDGLHDKLLSALGDAIVPAGEADTEPLRALLRHLSLDFEDVGSNTLPSYLVLKNEKGLIGCVGLEVFGEEAVLRSLAVEEGSRGGGYGWMLADSAINRARFRGVRRLYLITASASDFFAAKHGFRVVELSTVDERVANSTTFRLRDADSVAMRLDL